MRKSKATPKMIKKAKPGAIKSVESKKKLVARPSAKSLIKRSSASNVQAIETQTPNVKPFKWTKIQTAEGWRRARAA